LENICTGFVIITLCFNDGTPEGIPKSPFVPPKDFCLLPPELGYSGEVKFIEDCVNLEWFETVPLPGHFHHKLGIHPVVCCPHSLPKLPTVYDDDANQTNTGDSEDSGDYDYDNLDIKIIQSPSMKDEDCRINGQLIILPGIELLSKCVPLNQCIQLLDNDYAPQNQIYPCGFDEDSELLMICCSESFLTKPVSLVQKPRYSASNGQAREVEDKSKLCQKWKNNDGCRLDKDLLISKLDPHNGIVRSKVLFDFMQGACLKTCGWAKKERLCR